MILEGEIKDAKMSSFSFDFQTLMKMIDELGKEHSGISKQNCTFPSGPSKECSELQLPLFLPNVFKVVLYLSLRYFQILLLLTRCILVLVNTLIT